MEKKINIDGLKGNRPVTLPEQFSSLNDYKQWALATETLRNDMRHRSSMQDIEAFSQAMLAQLDDALAYLDTFEQEPLPEQAQALMSMVLALAEVAPAIEFYGQQAVIDGFDPRRFIADSAFKLAPAL
ncbi:hypothetical protein [Advenella mimigardefordensis]|uniref:Uncharacterized protein n=1 Tax=Advenella mimigardefordensis (strain DSM 17166 / LMG 22922 / DPN7) TaxID=1247726 RepID=W0PIH5_ADVMD|nr:hypothetical protein [Advenella mimigardefordensis]AHG65225.1 hypothetical protein MIM_c31610 [Advenella mimigardefordensis DPN7]